MKTRKRFSPADRRYLAALRSETGRLFRARLLRVTDPAIAPGLWSLAMAAREATGRTVEHNGIHFPLRRGVWVYVDCPETKQRLLATPGRGSWL